MPGQAATPGKWRRRWTNLWLAPKSRWMLGIPVGAMLAFAAGIVFWGGFNTAMELSSTETFCISCHEMADNVYVEYQETIHYSNRTGVRATCPDCHVPRPWIYKIVRKIQASNELYHHFFTREIDTPEKYEENRFKLAMNVWTAMKNTDSRECRNCHDYESMDFSRQEERAVTRHEEMEASYDAPSDQHKQAAQAGLTCIDCHKGVAHSLPAEYEPEKDIPGESPYYKK